MHQETNENTIRKKVQLWVNLLRKVKKNTIDLTWLFTSSLVLQLKVPFTCWHFCGSARGKTNEIKSNPYQYPMLYAMWETIFFLSCKNYPEICGDSVSIFDGRICCIWICSSLFVQAAGLCRHFSDILKDSSLGILPLAHLVWNIRCLITLKHKLLCGCFF